ncbi:MAG: hypothetical protein NTV79_05920 [Candidatus Aureabacteria bacterium]|nr:hypothetical protein [Candidatus Auribacterota bacterium]
MGDGLAGIRLLKPPLDFSEKQETFHGVLDGGVIRKVLNGPAL